MTLVMYALKCDVPYEELKENALSLVDLFDRKTKDRDNHFTEDDVHDALKAYKDCYVTFPRDTISKITGIPLQVNKRNGRARNQHLILARGQQEILDKIEGKNWREGNGRPKGSVKSAETSLEAQKIFQWRCNNPQNKSLCAQETLLDRKTVRKWWDEVDPEERKDLNKSIR